MVQLTGSHTLSKPFGIKSHLWVAKLWALPTGILMRRVLFENNSRRRMVPLSALYAVKKMRPSLRQLQVCELAHWSEMQARQVEGLGKE